MMFRVVVLPQPEGPRMDTNSFSRNSRSTPRLLNALPTDAKEELIRGFRAANQMLDYLFEQTKGD